VLLLRYKTKQILYDTTMTRQKIQGIKATFYDQVDQELHRQCKRKKTDEGALHLRDIKESASYNLPTLSDSKHV
jgi:hypothetical protein